MRQFMKLDGPTTGSTDAYRKRYDMIDWGTK